MKLLDRAQADAITGEIEISFRGGVVKHASRKETHFAPQPPKCPQQCGPMEEKDYGNLYVCGTCGTKRTRAQIERAK